MRSALVFWGLCFGIELCDDPPPCSVLVRPLRVEINTSTMSRLHLFEALGLEIELMIVDRDTLDVLPICDRLLATVAGEVTSEVEVSELVWCNELVLHVVELKTNGPTRDVVGALDAFRRDVGRINGILAEENARLLPGGMHPWMSPHRETRLWPHEHGLVYRTYDRIFGCRSHGWSNLQSLHLNLPFAGDGEFGRLHASTRLVLPLLPALAASSPFHDGQATGLLDNRIAVYRMRSRKVPSVAGEIVPEPVFTEVDYDREIFQRMYRDIARHDRDGVLREEFLNSRGAVARFDRGSIEIRALDAQECPRADLAIAALVVAVLQWLVGEHPSDLEQQKAVTTTELAAVLDRTIRNADSAEIGSPGLLEALGLVPRIRCGGAIWQDLRAAVSRAGFLDEDAWGPTLDTILEEGPLARRLLQMAGPRPDRATLATIYRELADCLAEDRLFDSSLPSARIP